MRMSNSQAMPVDGFRFPGMTPRATPACRRPDEVAHRVDLLGRAEHLVQTVQAPSQLQECVPGLAQAHLVILGHAERLGRGQVQEVLVLQGTHRRDVVGSSGSTRVRTATRA